MFVEQCVHVCVRFYITCMLNRMDEIIGLHFVLVLKLTGGKNCGLIGGCLVTAVLLVSITSSCPKMTTGKLVGNSWKQKSIKCKCVVWNIFWSRWATGLRYGENFGVISKFWCNCFYRMFKVQRLHVTFWELSHVVCQIPKIVIKIERTTISKTVFEVPQTLLETVHFDILMIVFIT